MTAEDAAWVRQNAWTKQMRREYAGDLTYVTTCACQHGPTGFCLQGSHRRCNRDTALPRWEALICDRAGIYPVSFSEEFQHETPGLIPHRERLAMVWLADRICRWRCPCDCHAAPRRAVEQLDLFEEVA
jgi:hypothetical protein